MAAGWRFSEKRKKPLVCGYQNGWGPLEVRTLGFGAAYKRKLGSIELFSAFHILML